MSNTLSISDRDISLCNSIKERYSKNLCFTRLALKYQDTDDSIDPCFHINDVIARNYCLKKLAETVAPRNIDDAIKICLDNINTFYYIAEDRLCLAAIEDKLIEDGDIWKLFLFYYRIRKTRLIAGIFGLMSIIILFFIFKFYIKKLKAREEMYIYRNYSWRHYNKADNFYNRRFNYS